MQIPVVPVALVATAGNAQVVLTWTASSGATSYHVKRGMTSGGPYAQVGAPTSASYTGTGLTNGTTYYYVVTALNSAGETANSTQVSATPVAPVTPDVTVEARIAGENPGMKIVLQNTTTVAESTSRELSRKLTIWGFSGRRDYSPPAYGR